MVVDDDLLLFARQRLHVPALRPNAFDLFNRKLHHALGAVIALGHWDFADADHAVGGEVSFFEVGWKTDARIPLLELLAPDGRLRVSEKSEHYTSVFVTVSVTAESARVDAASVSVTELSLIDVVLKRRVIDAVLQLALL